MHTNHGRCPLEAEGKRIRGVLRNGTRFGFEPVANAVPAGWAADGKGACNWSLDLGDWSISEWEVIG